MNTTMHRVSATKPADMWAVADITRIEDLPNWYCSVYTTSIVVVVSTAVKTSLSRFSTKFGRGTTW
jgi:hypothetical protein